MSKKEKPFNPYPRSKREERNIKKWINKLTVTPERMKELNKQEAERIKKYEEWMEWQIKEYGYFDPMAADY